MAMKRRSVYKTKTKNNRKKKMIEVSIMIMMNTGWKNLILTLMRTATEAKKSGGDPL